MLLRLIRDQCGYGYNHITVDQQTPPCIQTNSTTLDSSQCRPGERGRDDKSSRSASDILRKLGGTNGRKVKDSGKACSLIVRSQTETSSCRRAPRGTECSKTILSMHDEVVNGGRTILPVEVFPATKRVHRKFVCLLNFATSYIIPVASRLWLKAKCDIFATADCFLCPMSGSHLGRMLSITCNTRSPIGLVFELILICTVYVQEPRASSV